MCKSQKHLKTSNKMDSKIYQGYTREPGKGNKSKYRNTQSSCKSYTSIHFHFPYTHTLSHPLRLALMCRSPFPVTETIFASSSNSNKLVLLALNEPVCGRKKKKKDGPVVISPFWGFMALLLLDIKHSADGNNLSCQNYISITLSDAKI